MSRLAHKEGTWAKARGKHNNKAQSCLSRGSTMGRVNREQQSTVAHHRVVSPGWAAREVGGEGVSVHRGSERNHWESQQGQCVSIKVQGEITQINYNHTTLNWGLCSPNVQQYHNPHVQPVRGGGVRGVTSSKPAKWGSTGGRQQSARGPKVTKYWCLGINNSREPST